MGLIGKLRRTLVLSILLGRRGVLELPGCDLLVERIICGLVGELTRPQRLTVTLLLRGVGELRLRLILAETLGLRLIGELTLRQALIELVVSRLIAKLHGRRALPEALSLSIVGEVGLTEVLRVLLPSGLIAELTGLKVLLKGVVQRLVGELPASLRLPEILLLGRVGKVALLQTLAEVLTHRIVVGVQSPKVLIVLLTRRRIGELSLSERLPKERILFIRPGLHGLIQRLPIGVVTVPPEVVLSDAVGVVRLGNALIGKAGLERVLLLIPDGIEPLEILLPHRVRDVGPVLREVVRTHLALNSLALIERPLSLLVANLALDGPLTTETENLPSRGHVALNILAGVKPGLDLALRAQPRLKLLPLDAVRDRTAALKPGLDLADARQLPLKAGRGDVAGQSAALIEAALNSSLLADALL